MDFPWPPPSPPSGRNASLADELPDYSTSPTVWLAAVARKVYPASDCYHGWDIQITTEAAAPASSSEDHHSTPRCDVITISHSASRTVLILVAGPDDDEVSLESPRSEAEEKADAAAIIWQRRRACLQQQWERHNLGDESDETKAPSIHGAVLVRGQLIFGEYPGSASPSWVNTTDNDAPLEPWRLSENEGRAWFADKLLEIRLSAGEPRYEVAYWVWTKLGLSYADWLNLGKYDPLEFE